MVSEFVEKCRTLLTAHHVANLLLSVLFIMTKTLSPVCDVMYEDCELKLKEMDWLTFLGCIIVVKTRKHDTYNSYISTACLFAKLLNIVMFFKYSLLYAAVYFGTCALHFAFLPEPVYTGPESIVYFRGPHLEEELNRDRRITWVVTFYAAWSPPCVTFAPIFAQLSNDYHLDNLKFGKIDVTRYPAVAEKFQIDCSSWSKQLPTVILFKEGLETVRRPLIAKSRALRFPLTKESILKEFDLNQVYNYCKKNPLPARKDKKKEGKKDK